MKRRQIIIISGIAGVLIVAIAAILVVTRATPGTSAPKFDLTAQPVLGNPRAPVKVVEFFDFKCPSCKWFHDNILPQLKRQYIDNGTVALYAMNFPIIGPDSYTAAEAGEAVYRQNADAFWAFFDAVFAAQGNENVQWATPDFLVQLARQADPSIDVASLRQALSTQQYRNDVNADYLAGQLAGINSTPTLYVNGVEDAQFQDYQELQRLIDRAK